MDYTSLNDADLWDLVVAGDKKAYSHIYTSYCPEMFRYGLKFTADSQLIEDVMHDLLVKIWEKKDKIQINNSIKFYLLSAFRRDLIRQLNFLKSHQPLEDSHQDIAWEASFQELLIEKQIYLESDEKLKNTLSALSPRQKEAMYLRYVEGLTYEEIGAMMQIKTQSVYNLIFRSIQFLKDQLKGVNFYLKTLAFLVAGWQL